MDSKSELPTEIKPAQPKIQYKVTKKISDGKTDVVYFLRCLWYLVNDPKSDHFIHWHPTESDKFVIEVKEQEMDAFLKEYDGFKGTWMTFRRSMYFYGFKKSKNLWYHNELDKNDRNSLKRIKRVSKARKKKESIEDLRNRYMQLMMQQMQHIQTHNHLMSLTPQQFSPPTDLESNPDPFQQMNNFNSGPQLAPLHHPQFITPPNFGGIQFPMPPAGMPNMHPPALSRDASGRSSRENAAIPTLNAHSTTTSFSPLEFTAQDLLPQN